MLKTIDSDKEKFGLVVPYNKLGKQNITSYLVGTSENGQQKLKHLLIHLNYYLLLLQNLLML